MSLRKSLLIIGAILLVDQLSKFYVKTHFELGESIDVFNWFKILFIENSGAAWGAKLSDFLPVSESTGKLVLTVFRLFAVAGIGYWLFDTIRKKSSKTLILAVSLIFAGALGNIIDSVFYGMLFNDSYQQIASAFSDQPYGSLFYGKVVDMLYFPLIDTTWPEWVPFVGGGDFRFFEPVFNIADMAISTGVGILIVFNKKAFGKEAGDKAVNDDEVYEDATAEDSLDEGNAVNENVNEGSTVDESTADGSTVEGSIEHQNKLDADKTGENKAEKAFRERDVVDEDGVDRNNVGDGDVPNKRTSDRNVVDEDAKDTKNTGDYPESEDSKQ